MGNSGGHRPLLEFPDEALMDEPVPEAAKYLKDESFLVKRTSGEGTKARAQRSRIIADKLGQSFMRIEEKDTSCKIQLEK